MKKFEFSMQYLLDAHKAKEQAAEQALLIAAKKQADAEKAVLTKHEQRMKQVLKFETMNSGVVQRSDYAAYIRHIERLQQDVVVLENKARAQMQKVESCRLTLRTEMTSRRVMEKLYEREREEWSEELISEEQKQMDELAVVRWSRQEK